MLQQIAAIKNMLSGRNPNEIFENMLNSNPQFREFYNANKGKTPEQIADAYGIGTSVLDMLR